MSAITVRRALWCVAPLLLAAGPQGCTRFDWMTRIGDRIEPVARGIEEYGTVSMSSPVLTEPPGYFKFDVGKTGRQFYDDARTDVAGEAALFSQQALDAQFGLKLQADINALLFNLSSLEGFSDDLSRFKRAQALQELQASTGALTSLAGVDKAGLQTSLAQLQAALQTVRQQQASGTTPPEPSQAEKDLLAQISDLEAQLARANRLESQLTTLSNFTQSSSKALNAPTSRPAFPELKDGNLPTIDTDVLPTTRPAQDVLTSKQFTKFGELLKDRGTLKLTNRAALVTAAGDTVTSALLQFLSDPQEVEKFKDKIVLFGVSMVSVAPGNRTYRGYAAEVALSVSYEYQPAREHLLEKLKSKAGYAEPGSEIIARAYRQGQPWVPSDPNKIDDYHKTLYEIGSWSREFEQSGGCNEKNLPELLDALRMRLALKAWRNRDGALSSHEIVADANSIGFPDLNCLKDFLRRIPSDPNDLNDPKVARFAQGAKPAFVSRMGSATDIGVRYDRAPLVAAVSPFTDSQTLDLTASLRDQRARALQFAAALSAMGAKVQAKYFEDYVKRIERDIATRTNENFVSAFSTSGGLFGYQIGPRLRALNDPSSERAGPDYILERMSFPVLIILGLDADDLGVRIRPRFDEDLKTGRPDRDPNSLLVEIVEPMLKLRQTTRWIPLGNPATDAWFLGLGREVDQFFFKKRLSESERMSWAARLFEANTTLDAHERELRRQLGAHVSDPNGALPKGCIKPAYSQGATHIADGIAPIAYDDALDPRAGQMAAIEYVRNRIKVLDYAALDSTTYQAIPEDLFFRNPTPKEEPKLPQLDRIVPASVSLPADPNSAEVRFALTGQNLDLDPNKVTLEVYPKDLVSDPVLTDPNQVRFSDSTIIVTLPKVTKPGVLFFVLTHGKTKLISPPFTVLKPLTPSATTQPELLFRRSGTQGSVPFEDALGIYASSKITDPNQIVHTLEYFLQGRDKAASAPKEKTPPEQSVDMKLDLDLKAKKSGSGGGSGSDTP